MNIFLFKKISSALQDHLNSEHPADSNLSYFFKNNTNLGIKERGEVAETYYGIIRNKLLYEELNAIKPAREFSRCTLDY